ncbi:glycoside hydrolase family 5 protein [Fretibacter rubidus]|uniref:glycoside hydrolase family 5 protein n=1 Tax=Fretibacter rubidus TaxID=570162 RepID=UPI00352B7ED2
MTRFSLALLTTAALIACSPVEPAQMGEALATVPTSTKTAHTDHSYFPVKRCMNIGNALEAEYEGAWGYTVRRQDLAAIATAGFDTIRLPVRWDLRTQTRPPYKIEQALFNRVDEVIAWANALGLGVILDVHHFETLSTDMTGETPRFLAIWKQIAEHYKDAPDTLYFELFNEPTADAGMGQTNALYAKALPIIRATNPTRPVIIGGNRWNSVDTLADVIFPDDPYLVATFHDYGPHAFTHQGAQWDPNPPPIGRGWGSRADKAELKETYDIARKFQARSGLPVFVGEFGVIDNVPIAKRAEWTKLRRQAMEREGYGWCAWDLVGRFASYDEEAEQWLPGMKDAFFGR